MQSREVDFTSLAGAKNTTIFSGIRLNQTSQPKTIITIGTSHGEDLSHKKEDLQKAGNFIEQYGDSRYLIILEKPSLTPIKKDHYAGKAIYRTGLDFVQNDLAKRHQDFLKDRGVTIRGTDGRKQFLSPDTMQSISLLHKSPKDFLLNADCILNWAQDGTLMQLVKKIFEIGFDLRKENNGFIEVENIMNNFLEFRDGTNLSDILNALHAQISPLVQTLTFSEKEQLRDHFLDDIQEKITNFNEDYAQFDQEEMNFRVKLEEKNKAISAFKNTPLYQELSSAGIAENEILLSSGLEVDPLDLRHLVNIPASTQQFRQSLEQRAANELINHLIVRLGDLPLILETITCSHEIILIAYGKEHTDFLNSYLKRIHYLNSLELREAVPSVNAISITTQSIFAVIDNNTALTTDPSMQIDGKISTP